MHRVTDNATYMVFECKQRFAPAQWEKPGYTSKDLKVVGSVCGGGGSRGPIGRGSRRNGLQDKERWFHGLSLVRHVSKEVEQTDRQTGILQTAMS